ncbi:MAG TPA: cyclic 2,3-diphosphoglycerate synthase [Candidatus Edwardsbacteria bacterium]|nr:cyclic 2,3-diphosphoglycerate synthase [Candidatus Edwardsbacteria bacterium]
MAKKRVLIMGAAGRDFHNFNVYFRDNKDYQVVAFTATQIPDIAGRKYPAALAGKLYPKGIPIFDEKDLTKLIATLKVEQVVFAYSDLPYAYVMGKGAVVNAAGADFIMLGPDATMVKSKKPMISVCAVRTGCGKSQTTRRVIEILMAMGKKVVAIRHPMPYGDLAKQKVQRFATVQDLAKHHCTIEEMEEYEPHVVRGNVIYAGVDYEAIVRQAEKEADVIVWDGGNNDFPFYKSDLEIVVVDPHRPGHELSYYPGEVNLRRADVVVINKEDSASKENIALVKQNIAKANPAAVVIDANSPVTVEKGETIRGKKVLVIEDGPTLTHGEMKYGAGVVVAQKFGAAAMVDPRPYAVGTIDGTFKKYPGIGVLLPAMGYSKQQIADLQATINNTPCDLYVIGTPIDLRRLVTFPKPALRVEYELAEISKPDLAEVIKKKIKFKK